MSTSQELTRRMVLQEILSPFDGAENIVSIPNIKRRYPKETLLDRKMSSYPQI